MLASVPAKFFMQDFAEIGSFKYYQSEKSSSEYFFSFGITLGTLMVGSYS